MDGKRRSARLASKPYQSLAAAIPAKDAASQLSRKSCRRVLMNKVKERGLSVYKQYRQRGTETKGELVDLLLEDEHIQATLNDTKGPDHRHTLRQCDKIFSIVRYSGNGGGKKATVIKRGNKLAEILATSLTKRDRSKKAKPIIILFTFVHWKCTSDIPITPRVRLRDRRSESQADHRMGLALSKLQPNESVCFLIQGYDGFCCNFSSWKKLQDMYPSNNFFLAFRERYKRMRGSLSTQAWLEVRKYWVGNSEDDLYAVFELRRLVRSESGEALSAAERHLIKGMGEAYRVRADIQKIYAREELKPGRHVRSIGVISA